MVSFWIQEGFEANFSHSFPRSNAHLSFPALQGEAMAQDHACHSDGRDHLRLFARLALGLLVPLASQYSTLLFTALLAWHIDVHAVLGAVRIGFRHLPDARGKPQDSFLLDGVPSLPGHDHLWPGLCHLRIGFE